MPSWVLEEFESATEKDPLVTSRVEPEARVRLLTEIDPEVVTVIPATLTTASSSGPGTPGVPF